MLWLDSSARVLSSNWSSPWSEVVGAHGALLLSISGHSNFAVTHPGMYHYLPSSVNDLKRTGQGEANQMLLYRTHQTYHNVIKWWVLCALDKDCIAPIMNRFCHFPQNDRFMTYANCHRFDQAAINILLANLYEFDDRLYQAKDKLVEILRGSRKVEGKLENC